MSRPRLYQIAVIAALIVLLEVLCLAGVIDKITMPPPHIILRDFVRMVLAGRYFGEIGKSLANVLVAFASAYLIGVIIGTILHGHKTTREILDPLFATYYAIPVFAFYPLFIVMFGLGDGPQVLIGFMLAIVAVIVTTLNGLDRVPPVLKKTARVNRLNALQTARHSHPAVLRALPVDRSQVGARLCVHWSHRFGIHYGAFRHGLRNQLRLYKF